MIEKLKAEVKALRAQLEENGIKPNIEVYRLKALSSKPEQDETSIASSTEASTEQSIEQVNACEITEGEEE